MLPTKVEIKLKKAEAVSWGRLDYRKLNSTNSTDSETSVKKQNTDSAVESVDLEDLNG